MNPSVFAREQAQSHPAYPLRQVKPPALGKDQAGDPHAQVHQVEDAAGLLAFPVHHLARNSISTSGMLILTGQTS